jgi:hypothetical protein
MKYFPSDLESFWKTKVNFVDENNVLVGYDFHYNCCEEFGWYIKENVSSSGADVLFNRDTNIEAINQSLHDWNFDSDFFQEINEEIRSKGNYVVVFRLVNGDNELFLHLYNVHSGYYSHGFDFSKDGEIIKSGSI